MGCTAVSHAPFLGCWCWEALKRAAWLSGRGAVLKGGIQAVNTWEEMEETGNLCNVPWETPVPFGLPSASPGGELPAADNGVYAARFGSSWAAKSQMFPGSGALDFPKIGRNSRLFRLSPAGGPGTGLPATLGARRLSWLGLPAQPGKKRPRAHLQPAAPSRPTGLWAPYSEVLSLLPLVSSPAWGSARKLHKPKRQEQASFGLPRIRGQFFSSPSPSLHPTCSFRDLLGLSLGSQAVLLSRTCGRRKHTHTHHLLQEMLPDSLLSQEQGSSASLAPIPEGAMVVSVLISFSSAGLDRRLSPLVRMSSRERAFRPVKRGRSRPPAMSPLPVHYKGASLVVGGERIQRECSKKAMGRGGKTV